MCIIAYKPKGVELMGRTIIKHMMENNPNGAGYCFITNEGVFIRKGFWSAKKLDRSLMRDLATFNLKHKDVDIIIHSRIATSGLTKPENCHPFPITDNVSTLRETCLMAPFAFVHNGMIDLEDDKNKSLSDTMVFVRDILAKIDFSEPLPDHMKTLLELALHSSKVLILGVNGIVFTSGKYDESEGIFYSNSTYKETELWAYPQGKFAYSGSYARTPHEGFAMYDNGYTRDDKYPCGLQRCDLCGCDSNKVVFVEDMYLCPDCVISMKDYNEQESIRMA